MVAGEREKVTLDLGVTATITLAEWADIEDAARRSLIGVDLVRPPMWVIAGLLWIVRRRDDPSARYADFAGLRIGDITWGGEGDANPTPAAESPAA